uniref:Putative secreted protein 94 n=1 Tax=Amblyomma cajennense TaxID=34607 RepID=A0A023FU39_AMBCJ
MILIAFFIAGFGLCAAKRAALYTPKPLNSTILYERTYNMVRRTDTLRLLMFSPGIENKVPNCLISKYLSKAKGVAHRTLETNFIDKEETLHSVKSHVRIAVTNASQPYLQIAYEKGSLATDWTYAQDVKYAIPKKCIILEHSFSEVSGRRHPCTLWGYKHSITCQKIFVLNCGLGRVVNLTKCTKAEKKKGKPKKGSESG